MFRATKDFLGKEAPPGYIPGKGRGATGFTTSIDLGPITESAIDIDDRFADPDNEVGLFASLPLEKDDIEAERIYDDIDRKMANKRKKNSVKEETMQETSIQQKFADAKRALVHVTQDEWANLPDAVSFTKKRKTAQDLFTPLPDNIILSGRENTSNVVVEEGNATFAEMNEARGQVLGIRLDQLGDSKSGQSTVDPKGYLTNLESVAIQSNTEVGDVKKARLLLQSVVKSNPKHVGGWIALARLEEVTGKLAKAREIITKGCGTCAKKEDVWLEAIRLYNNRPEEAQMIVANAARHIPKSVQLWLHAAEMEKQVNNKKRVLRKGLENVPKSVKLWKELISIEESKEDAKILLSRAVECVPSAVEFWLALSRLESYENAQKVLNKARSANPTSHEIWIAAAKLEEQHGSENRVGVIIQRAVKVLSERNVEFTREQWVREAQVCESNQFLVTCESIVRATITLGLEPEDVQQTLLEEADTMSSQKFSHVARSIYAYLLSQYSDSEDIWMRAAMFEKTIGSTQAFDDFMSKGTQLHPTNYVLWLMWAKEKWMTGNVDGARELLQKATSLNENNEEIWLAAVKLETETGNLDKAKILLAKARELSDSPRVWMKAIMIERIQGNLVNLEVQLISALQKHPTFDKLWMIKSQVEQENGKIEIARDTLSKSLNSCPKSITLWLLSARLEESLGSIVKARALLEKARLLNPKTAELWLEAVRVEVKAKNVTIAKTIMTKALQECPTSDILWNEAIFLEPRQNRRAKSVDAFAKCENSALVACAIARLFAMDGKFDKARKWFSRATLVNKDIGDEWAWWYAFELQHGSLESAENVFKEFEKSDPHHGELWCKVNKDLKNREKALKERLNLAVKLLPYCE